jgi:hypothetical protein
MQELPNPDPEARGVGGLLSLLFGLFRTDVRPTRPRLLRWYDRVVAVVGGLILIALLMGMVYVALTRNP